MTDITYFGDHFTVTQYPAGERHIEARPDWHPRGAIIADHVRDFNGIMDLVVATDILDMNGIANFEWVVPYMPYARHDRRNHRGDGLELRHAIEMLQSIGASIIDPHSDVAGILPHYTQAHVVAEFADKGLFETAGKWGDPAHQAIVAIPDAGATKKTYTWLEDRPRVQCLKTRDPATGKLSGFQVIGDDLGGKKVVIVDDICDAGRTFLGLAAELKALNAGPLALAVTHGLFTKGLDALFDVFDQIYTLDIYTDDTRVIRASTTDLIRRNRPT